MTRTRLIVGASLIGLAVLTVALFVDSLRPVYTPGIDSFQRTADPRKIVVTVTVGLGDEFADRQVREDDRSVTVTVHVRQLVANKVALGVPVPVVVTLKEPLADRTVRDPRGNAVRDAGSYRAP